MLLLLRDRVTSRISGFGRGSSLSLAGSSSRRRKTSNPNQAWRGMGSARLYLPMIPAPPEMTTISQPIPDLSSPGSTRTTPFAAHHNGGEKYATGVTTSKSRVKNNITIGTWNVRALRMAGKLEELTYHEQVPLEHHRSLRSTMENVWRDIHSGGS